VDPLKKKLAILGYAYACIYVMLVAYICIHRRFSFVCRKSYIPHHIILLTQKNISIMILEIH